jgi:hypothetical protein
MMKFRFKTLSSLGEARGLPCFMGGWSTLEEQAIKMELVSETPMRRAPNKRKRRRPVWTCAWKNVPRCVECVPD